MKHAAALLLLLSAEVGTAPAPLSTPIVHVIPREREFLDDTRVYEATLPSGAYSIRRDSSIRRLVVNGLDARETLTFDPSYRIYTLFALTVDQDLVVFYEASNDLESTGSIVRLDGRTLTVKWVATGPSMNIAPPVVCEDSLCAAGHGSVVRVVLATGRIAWSHYDLYEQLHAFNAPEGLVVANGSLIVHESLASYDHRESKTMVFNLTTGEYSVK